MANAYEKLERAQRHGEDKKQANEKMITRLKEEFEQMAMERRDNDKQLEELRVETNHIHSEVGLQRDNKLSVLISSSKDGGPPQEKRSGTQRVARRVLEIKTRDW